MAAAYVKWADVIDFASSTTVAVAFGSNVGAGNLICGMVTWPSVTATLISVTDKPGQHGHPAEQPYRRVEQRHARRALLREEHRRGGLHRHGHLLGFDGRQAIADP